MKMNKILLALGLAVSAVTSVYAAAPTTAGINVEKDIAVSAVIGQSIDMLNADGTALPTSAALQWNGTNFSTFTNPVIIRTANRAVGAVVTLLNTPALTNGASTPIPLTVKLAGNVLGTTATTFAAATLFGTSTGAGDSQALSFTIGAPVPGTPSTGTYTGEVQMSLAQGT